MRHRGVSIEPSGVNTMLWHRIAFGEEHMQLLLRLDIPDPHFAGVRAGSHQLSIRAKGQTPDTFFVAKVTGRSFAFDNVPAA